MANDNVTSNSQDDSAEDFSKILDVDFSAVISREEMEEAEATNEHDIKRRLIMSFLTSSKSELLERMLNGDMGKSTHVLKEIYDISGDYLEQLEALKECAETARVRAAMLGTIISESV